MSSLEKSTLKFIKAYDTELFFVIISALGFLIRFLYRNFESGDAKTFLLPWFYQIKDNGGLYALKYQVGNYGVLYQTLIAIMTYLPFNPLSLYKGLSIFFDYLLAIALSIFSCEICNKKTKTFFVAVYVTALLLPTVIFNSALWGQCDSIYSFFIVTALFFLWKRKYFISFVFLGIAFGLKLQTIFVIPFYLYFYIAKKEYSILNFVVIFCVWYATNIPAFIAGRDLLQPLEIYFEQTNTYLNMWLNFPSVWVFTSDNYSLLAGPAILITISVLGVGMFFVIKSNVDLINRDIFLQILAWTLWTSLILLPAMHERYTYMLDLVLIVLAFRNYKFTPFALITSYTSFLLYCYYLFGNNLNLEIIASAYLIAYSAFTACILKNMKREEYHKIKITED